MTRQYLVDLRKEKGGTIEKLTKHLGITKQYYWYIEKGFRMKKMDVETLAALADYFDVPIEELVKQELLYYESICPQNEKNI